MNTALATWTRTHLGPQGPVRGTRVTGSRFVPVAVGRPTSPTARSPYHRDLEAIRTSWQLQRLDGIGQVFAGGGDGYTTRLTHSEEVAGIAELLAEQLGLDETLARAIGLAHDCGHPPLSHTAEPILRTVYPCFSHGKWAADYQLADLRLSAEVVDGVRNHSWSSPSPSTAEAELVKWADRFAYLPRDYRDGLLGGFISANQPLPDLVVKHLGLSAEQQRAAAMSALIESSSRTGVVSINEDVARALAAFRAFNAEHFYGHAWIEEHGEGLAEAVRQIVADVRRTAKEDSVGHTIAAEVTRLTDSDVVDHASAYCL